MKKSDFLAVLIPVMIFGILITGIFFFRHGKQIITNGDDAETVNNAEVIDQNGRININTADAPVLMLLPGIGQVTAERIIAYRIEHGPFPTIYDLCNVYGIGDAKFNDIKYLITVGG